MKHLSVVATMMLLTACANYQVTTNVDPQEIKRYFAPANVKVFDDESQFPAAYVFKGAVSGESCQHAHNLPEATVEEAKVQARTAAAKIEANAIIFSSCHSIDVQGCLSAQLCYGKAFVIEK